MADHKRLLRNLIVCTSQLNWDVFCRQIAEFDWTKGEVPDSLEDKIVHIFRFVTREAVLSFHPTWYSNNVRIMSSRPPKEPVDCYQFELGRKPTSIYFEMTPYSDRILFHVKEDHDLILDMIKNPIQVGYPECMFKPLNWIPFVAQVAFDGQASVDISRLWKDKR